MFDGLSIRLSIDSRVKGHKVTNDLQCSLGLPISPMAWEQGYPKAGLAGWAMAH